MARRANMRRRELGQRDDVALGAGPIARGPLEEVEDAESPELGPDRIGGGRDQVAHLVERLGPTFAGRGPGHAQNPHGFDVSVPRLGLTAGLAREGSPGGRDGVLGIGLALEPPALSVGPVDFDDTDIARPGGDGSARRHRTRSLRRRPARRGRSRSASPATSCSHSRWWRSSRRRGGCLARLKPQLHGRRGAYRPRR